MTERDVLSAASKAWPVVLTIAGVIGASYVARETLTSHTEQIASLNAASRENDVQHRGIQERAAATGERFDGIQRQLTRQSETIDRINMTLSALCATTRGCIPAR